MSAMLGVIEPSLAGRSMMVLRRSTPIFASVPTSNGRASGRPPKVRRSRAGAFVARCNPWSQWSLVLARRFEAKLRCLTGPVARLQLQSSVCRNLGSRSALSKYGDFLNTDFQGSIETEGESLRAVCQQEGLSSFRSRHARGPISDAKCVRPPVTEIFSGGRCDAVVSV